MSVCLFLILWVEGGGGGRRRAALFVMMRVRASMAKGFGQLGSFGESLRPLGSFGPFGPMALQDTDVVCWAPATQHQPSLPEPTGQC